MENRKSCQNEDSKINKEWKNALHRNSSKIYKHDMKTAIPVNVGKDRYTRMFLSTQKYINSLKSII